MFNYYFGSFAIQIRTILAIHFGFMFMLSPLTDKNYREEGDRGEGKNNNNPQSATSRRERPHHPRSADWGVSTTVWIQAAAFALHAHTHPTTTMTIATIPTIVTVREFNLPRSPGLAETTRVTHQSLPKYSDQSKTHNTNIGRLLRP